MSISSYSVSSSPAAISNQQYPFSEKSSINLPVEKSPILNILPQLGVYGYSRYEILIIASLVTRHPILLIGDTGTGKTLLLNKLSGALGLKNHRHYNASTITLDDLIGFPYPDEDKKLIKYMKTEASLWDAQSVFIDELNRARPENQNKLFSIINERRIIGIPLENLIYRWAAMNPFYSNKKRNNGDDYWGTEPLDRALADRFALFIESLDWQELTDEERRKIIVSNGTSDISQIPHQGLIELVSNARKEFCEKQKYFPQEISNYVEIAVNLLNGSGLSVSPRRSALLADTLLAASIINGGYLEEIFKLVLDCSMPHKCYSENYDGDKITMIHTIAWKNMQKSKDVWIYNFVYEQNLLQKIKIFLKNCANEDEGTKAISELIRRERPEIRAAFLYAIYPAALMGKLPIGNEGIFEIGRVVGPFLEVKLQKDFEGFFLASGSYPSMSLEDYLPREYAQVVENLAPCVGRKERAGQFFCGAVKAGIKISEPAHIEEQMNCVVQFLKNEVL